MPRSRSSPSTSLRDDDIQLDDSEKFESTGSWEALEWTKVDPVTNSVPELIKHFLFKDEYVTAEGHGVVLVNTDEAGTLFMTNFRLLFLNEGYRDIIALGTIPLATIEKFTKITSKLPGAANPRQADKTSSRRLLQITGKDMRIIVFGFRPRTKQRHAIYDQLLRWTKPLRIWDLYAYTATPSRVSSTNPKIRLLNEYFRLLGLANKATTRMIEDGSFTLSNKFWKISSVNSDYALCPTYPFALLVPRRISDEEVRQASTFRARSRLPIISWCNPRTGAVLARSSQPLVGFMMNMRSNADEKLVAALRTQLVGTTRKLYIADARPRKNALANGAMGGGSESSSNYFDSEIVFFGIDNIHTMKESFFRLRDYLDTHGATSSDGMSSYLRHGGWSWGGGNLSSMSASVSTFGDSGWLIHVQSILAGSAWIAARIDLESASVLVHCSDGWDRTTQLVSLASLLLDPYYRTIEGFQALVEKDWLASGHPFADRLGTPSVSGGGSMPLELSRQYSTGNIPPSPMRQMSGSSFTSQASTSSHIQNSYSPIFLQWVDCVSQLMRMYPLAFEFSSAFLVDLVDFVLSCRFCNFLCNSERERQEAGIFSCGCLWAHMVDLRAASGVSHVHYNPFYESSQHRGALLPPAAALAPTLWPQFHLRWSCPSESQSGETEAQCRNLAKRLTEVQKANEELEAKDKEREAILESMAFDLKNEKDSSNLAKDEAKRVTKENAAIKRAIQSLGINLHISEDGDCIVGIESNPSESSSQKSIHCSVKEGSGVSSNYEEVDDHALNRVCETLCPRRTREGGCRWPNASCAQVGSQFIGLRANFDAIDRMSLYDSYFQPE